MQHLCIDLKAEYCDLDNMVSALKPETWYRKTLFCGWTVFDTVAHIAFFDQQAALAIDSPDLFQSRAAGLIRFLHSGLEWPPYINALLGPDQPEDLLNLWRDIRTHLIERLSRMAPRDRILWYGPDMSARSFATARLMETWAHGQDICDTFGIDRAPTRRLFHIAHIGFSTFAWSFKVHNLTPPETPIRVELTGPSGEPWAWGDLDSPEIVRGDAKDFCLVVTQRRNVADTALTVQGEHVAQWLCIAQAFAGVAQMGPGPGERRNSDE